MSPERERRRRRRRRRTGEEKFASIALDDEKGGGKKTTTLQVTKLNRVKLFLIDAQMISGSYPVRFGVTHGAMCLSV